MVVGSWSLPSGFCQCITSVVSQLTNAEPAVQLQPPLPYLEVQADLLHAYLATASHSRESSPTNLSRLQSGSQTNSQTYGQIQLLIAASLHILASLACVYICSFEDLRQSVAVRQLGLLSSGHPETLVLYTYSNSDPEYERNLHFFVQYGMAEGDGCNYVIIVQQVIKALFLCNCCATRVMASLPSLERHMDWRH